jgi:hypothetical protein
VEGIFLDGILDPAVLIIGVWFRIELAAYGSDDHHESSEDSIPER